MTEPDSGALAGRHIVITGANTGIGRAAAVALAARGADLTLACRSRERTQPVLDELQNSNVRFLELDLASLSSVAAAAQRLDGPIHVLINNAGLAGQRGQTEDGFELAFGTNHLGHFLFTKLLLEQIVASAPARIVNVSSEAHYQAQTIDEDAIRRPTESRLGFKEYAVSKLANVLFTQELARRLDGTDVTVCAVHPGTIATDIWRGIPWPFRTILKKVARMKSVEEGAVPLVHAATAPGLVTGAYYENCAVRDAARAATPELAAWLWTASERWTGSLPQ